MVSPRRLVFALRLCFLVAAALFADDARAAVNQPPPGNEPMPVMTGQNEYSIWVARGFPMDAGTLAGLFKYHSIPVNGMMVAGGDSTIDPVADAHTTPGAFSPQCGLSGTIVLRGGGCKNALGWYNTTDNATTPPPANQIYQLVPANLQLAPPNGLMCMDADFCPLATRITTQIGQHTWTDVDFASNIRMDPRWTGGLIGLAMIGVPGSQCTQTKYSQAQLNDKSPSGKPWIATLIYQSVADPQSYYIAFEDLPTCATSWKGCNGSTTNDGDFNDFVFYVTGLTCNLGGKPCTVEGQMGICANGVTECAEGGTTTTCRQAVMPAPAELCNAVDDDCNGTVDEGDNLCPVAGDVCAEGRCVHPCDDSEFKCFVGLTCDTDGLCKDPRCIGKTCGAGQVCIAGTCVGGCDGVVCPHGEVCRLGNCVKPCAGVTCPADRICEGGACQPKCGACRSCATGFSCNMTSGICSEMGCENKMCADGQVCKPPGNCVDGCEGVTCPGGQECKMGKCTAIPLPDGPVTGTGGTGIIITGRGGSTGTGGGIAGSTGTGTAGSGTGTGGTTSNPPPKIDTCKCETAEGPGTPSVVLLLATFAIAGVRRRRPSAVRRR